MYNGSPEMTQGKDEQLIKKKSKKKIKYFTKIKLIKIKFVTEGRKEGRKDGTTDRGRFIGPFPSLLGGPIKCF